LFCEATWEEVWEKSLNGTEDENMSNGRKRNDPNNHHGDERDYILEGSSKGCDSKISRNVMRSDGQ
jgi:hypothetical protein